VASLTRNVLMVGASAALTLGLSATSFAQIIVPGYPYPGYRYAAPDAAVKFDVKPSDAAVYVDGYYAGLVDDYDGAFQRLRTSPGGHEITIYLEGYRTYSERVYLSVDNTLKVKHRMEKLAGGETAQRPPAPQPPPQYQPGAQPGEQGPGPQTRGPIRRGPGRPYPGNGPDNFPGPPPPGAEGGPGAPAGPAQADANSGRGTLALSLQPADAEVLVDGTPWRGDGGNRLTIDLSEGRHNIQIRKQGFIGYLTDVQIRRGETATLDVQLKTQPR
jgi:hypothetical protein